ncbi:MAG: alanine--tRNA ligase [Candidatus Bathyarchaeia archaeon]
MEIGEEEFSIPFFKDNEFIRLRCPVCGSFYWTQNPDSRNCGDAPCQPYTFIGDPPTKARYTLDEMRDKFIGYFDAHGHKPIPPYPIVARWRDDVYLVGASIYNFQPYVTEGVIPPPANPLVVSQPCIRLTDLDLVGPTNGRHLTIFEMGGAHAFNFPGREIYWKDETIRLHHELLTEGLGVRSEDVAYKEHFWSGGGNAGPDVEACISGLEISTLVFMKYKVEDGGLTELPIRTVDTGYGIERWTWLTQGSPSGFHPIYPQVIEEIAGESGVKLDPRLMAESTRLSSTLNLELHENRVEARRRLAELLDMDPGEVNEALSDMEAIYAIADHTKALAFILSEGVIPSNVEEGYLARLLARRTLRMLRRLGLEYDFILRIVELQIHHWGKAFTQLREMRSEILDALNVETEKYKRTLKKGVEKLNRIVGQLKDRGLGEIPAEVLTQLYDSHGLDPETVGELAPDMAVNPPEDFYSRIAQRHSTLRASPDTLEDGLKARVEGINPTVILYYERPEVKRFKAEVLRVIDDVYVVLDRTAFYPESGGQVADQGHLSFNDRRIRVVDVQKIGNVILHKVGEGDQPPPVGAEVIGEIDWERRLSLMRHHTATHILIGAARRLLGSHAWQAGARKEADRSRLDITHYRHLTSREVALLEEMACNVVVQDIPVEASWMPREEAERLYGFRIYQGGAVPGKELRIIKIGEWDVEACGGTHCQTTGQVGLIKILNVEHPQDGVERLIFATGPQALRHIQEAYRILEELGEALRAPRDEMVQAVEALREREKALEKELSRYVRAASARKAEELLSGAAEVDGIKLVAVDLGDVGEAEAVEVSSLIARRDPYAVAVLAFRDRGAARILVSAGGEAILKGVNAGEAAKALAPYIRGGGGGKPYFGQAGGVDASGIPRALAEAEEILRGMLEG